MKSKFLKIIVCVLLLGFGTAALNGCNSSQPTTSPKAATTLTIQLGGY